MCACVWKSVTKTGIKTRYCQSSHQGICGEKRSCPRDGNNAKAAHSFPVSFTFPPPYSLPHSLPSQQPLHLSVSVSVSCGMTYKDIQLNKVISSTSLRVYGEHALIGGFSLSAWNVLFLSVIHYTINFCNVSQCNFKCVNYYQKNIYIYLGDNIFVFHIFLNFLNLPSLFKIHCLIELLKYLTSQNINRIWSEQTEMIMSQ